MWKLKRLLGAGAPEKESPAPDLPVDPLNDAFLSDPYPIYAWLREAQPVADLAGGGYLLVRHADVEAALKSDAFGNAPSRFSRLAPKNRERFIAADLASHIPPFLDAPAHITPRKTLVRAFFRSFEGFEAQLSKLASDMLSDLPAGQEIDLINQFTSPFAIEAIRSFIGTGDFLDQQMTKEASLAFFQLFAPIRDGEQFNATEDTLRDTRQRLTHALEAAAVSETSSLLKHLKDAQHDYPDLTAEMIVDNAILVLADGIENIEAAIARTLHLILQHPEAVKGHDMPSIVREALRLETPAQIIPRVCQRTTEIAGVTFERDMPVFLALGSANRDPEAFRNADALQPDRSESSLTFGLGRHRCIGEQLGLRMIETAIEALMERGALLAEPASYITYKRRFGHRWPEKLAVVLT